ncbi:hypothetical protein [Chitinophaga sp.]|uniref:hypothetical protein n=1 Tax=Chitinophaga sp. TaxID=1869181 RepID=UPI0031D5910D
MPYFKRVFAPVILVLCLATACKKEYSYEGMPEIPKADTVKTPEVVYDYAPYTKGSTYNYMYKTQTATYYYTVTVTGDTVLQGNTYAVLSDGYNLQFIRYNKGGYYLFEPAYTSSTSYHPAAVRPFLYDNYALNAHWSDTIKATTFHGDPETALLDYHIIQKGTPKTVMGKTYSRVIGVKQDGYIIAGGQANSIGTIANYFYADSTGFIEKDSPTDTIVLLSYDRKN